MWTTFLQDSTENSNIQNFISLLNKKFPSIKFMPEIDNKEELPYLIDLLEEIGPLIWS